MQQQIIALNERIDKLTEFREFAENIGDEVLYAQMDELIEAALDEMWALTGGQIIVTVK